MPRPRIGELLRKMLRLSEMDVEEVLHEQHVTHRRFGEIALLLGMCAPQDVWNAWFSQLAGHSPWIDLNEFGIDAQAIHLVPADLAQQYNLVPLRVVGNHLVVAIAPQAPEPTADVKQRIKKELRFVRASAEQIQAVIEEHYGVLCVTA